MCRFIPYVTFSPGDETTFFFIRLTHLVESWDLNFLKLLFLGSLNQRDVLKNMRQIYIYGITKEVE